MMTIKITSHRGHHEAAVMEPEVSQAIYEKMTGKTEAPLPAEYKVKIPDNFGELEGLWKEGRLGYMAFEGKNGDMELIKEFRPEIDVLLFIAPQQAG